MSECIQLIAWLVLLCAATYLVGFGVIALLWPQRALQFLLGFATSVNKHRLELVLRLLFGCALLLHAPLLNWPNSWRLIGYVLIATTLVMWLLPWQWHRDFASKSVQKAAPWLPWMGIVSLLLGFGFIWNLLMSV